MQAAQAGARRPLQARANVRPRVPRVPLSPASRRVPRIVASQATGALTGRLSIASPPPSPPASGDRAAAVGTVVAVTAAAAAIAFEAPAVRVPDLSRRFGRYLMPDSDEYEDATLGSSSMAKRLRACVAAAAADAAQRPVCVQGEPGLRKHHVAAQIHYGSGEGADSLPLYKLDLAGSANPTAVLFGEDLSGTGGIVSSLRQTGGSLLLVNVHVLQQGPLRDTIKALLREARAGTLPFRMLMTSEQPLEDLNLGVTILKIPPLRARPGDVKDLAMHYLAVNRARTTGGQSLLLGNTALRQLLAYQYPVNLEELHMIVDRVAIQTMAAASRETAAATAGRPLPVAPAAPAAPAEAPLAVLATATAAPPAPAPAAKQGGCGCAGGCGSSTAAIPTKLTGCGGGCASGSTDGAGCCSGGQSLALAVATATAAEVASRCAASWETPAVATEECECEDLELCSSEFWFVTEEKDRFRINLLEVFPVLRDILKSGAYPAGLNNHVTPYVYPLLLAALFLGPQDRDHSVALNLVWCYWWPAIFILYPLLGRWWCSVCPFMVTGDLVQSWRAKLLPDVKFLKWPKKAAEEAGPWFVVGLFAVILIWEDVWHLNNNAALTGWLLSLITAGAVASGVLLPKRFWCRYLCPIGGMNGSQSGVCSSQCTSYSCLKGAPEGQQRADVPNGCPYSAHSNALVDNSICSLCSTCVAMCPHDNVELRLRPPGIDLWTLPQTSAAEAALLFLLMGAVFLHREDRVLELLHLDPALLDSQLAFCGIAAATLAAPGLLLWAAHSSVITGKLSASRLARFWSQLTAGSQDESGSSGSDSDGGGSSGRARSPRTPFVKLAYSYVPLVWGATLAVYSELLLREAGVVLQVGAASLGMAPDVAPGFEAHPAVVAFIQGSLVLGGLAGSVLLLAQYTNTFQRPRRKRSSHSLHLAEHAAIMAAAAACLWAVVVN